MSLPNFTEFRLFLGSPDSNEGTGIFRPTLDAEKNVMQVLLKIGQLLF